MKQTITLVLLLTVVALCACGSRKVTMGKAVPASPEITVAGAITSAPTQFEGKTVVVRGKISRECPAGCWFWIQDQTGELYVDIKPSNLAIPQRVGKPITVVGTVVLESGRPQLIGTGLEL